MDAGLHVGRAIAAGLQRVDSDNLVLGQPGSQCLAGVAAFEFDLGNPLGHEAVIVLGIGEVVIKTR